MWRLPRRGRFEDLPRGAHRPYFRGNRFLLRAEFGGGRTFSGTRCICAPRVDAAIPQPAPPAPARK